MSELYGPADTRSATHARIHEAYLAKVSMPSDRMPPESDSPIRDRLSDAEQRLTELLHIMDALEQRLDVVLSPVPPSPATTTGGVAPPRMESHLVGRLAILNEGLQHGIQRLRALMGRIEV